MRFTRLCTTLLAGVLGSFAAVTPADAEPPPADNGVAPLPIEASPLNLKIQKLVTVPDASTGKPQLNVMAFNENRTFIGEAHDGKIYEILGTRYGPKSLSLFVDLSAAIKSHTGRNLNIANAQHGGLRGLAFHPDFFANGKFYTAVMEDRPESEAGHQYLSDAATPIGADSVLIEWTMDLGTGRVSPDSYREVFRVGMPVYDHTIREITFNEYAKPGDPDYGLLYIGHGDGSVQSATAGGGQAEDALGKILRIDPLQSGSKSYAIPPTNPFIGEGGQLDEVYSMGHRNPHSLSFTKQGVLVVGEVGRDNIDEVNLIQAGGNYGWSQREGTFVHLPEGGVSTGVAPLPADDWVFGYTYPVVQLGHGSVSGSFVGVAIAGGYPVQNGSEFDGQYLYADFAVTGRVFHSSLSEMTAAKTRLGAGEVPSALTQAHIRQLPILYDHDGDPSTPPLARNTMLDVVSAEPTYDGSGRADLRFGHSPDGEIYIMNKRNGVVYLVTNTRAPSRPFPAPTEAGSVMLRSIGGRLLTAEGGGGTVVVADRERLGPWETWAVVDGNGGELKGGDPVALRSVNGQYLAADGGGGGKAIAVTGVRSVWETWELEDLNGGALSAGDPIALKSDGNTYLGALGGGGGDTAVYARVVRPWETWTWNPL